MNKLESISWKQHQLGDAILILANKAGFLPKDKTEYSVSNPHLQSGLTTIDSISRWLDWASDQISMEIEAVESNGEGFDDFLRNAGPMIILHEYEGQRHYLLLLKYYRRKVMFISPEGKLVTFSLNRIRAILWYKIEQAARQQIVTLIEQANIPKRQWPKITSVLLKQRMSQQCFKTAWMLRIPPSAKFTTQLHKIKVANKFVLMILLFVALYFFEILGWGLMGWGALEGRFDPGHLMAWALLLLTMIPLQLGSGWLQATISIDIGMLLKRRLLSGALNMKMDSIRQQGVGQLLGRVIESQAIDSLALNGGFSVLVAVIELSFAAIILYFGAGGILHSILLVFWVFIFFLIGKHYYEQLRIWTSKRLKLTHELVEKMVGHRTRLAQQSVENRHHEEDQFIEQFLQQSKIFDNTYVLLPGGLPRGWLFIGIAGLAPNFILGSANVAGLAVGLGGVLLAYRAFASAASGVSALSRAAVAWEQIKDIFQAATKLELPSKLQPMSAKSQKLKNGQSLIQGRKLVFTHLKHGKPILDQCDLSINRGDRILLEGPSGCGKSTLASILVGLRQASSGLLLLNGLDKMTWGRDWGRQVTAAPQFHENHILSGTLAFNLLMGRQWPASEADMAEAKLICRQLGLSELLERMPGGLMQMVGETGWQLSHGERSRIYLARALLQKSEFIVLDESFAALDPFTLRQCLTTALNRSPTLLLIAHR